MRICPKSDRGRKRLSPSPPSEPCVRFSRTRLSSRWFPHRDWLPPFQAAVVVNSPRGPKNFFCPRVIIISTKSHARSLLLLSQHRPQSSAYKAIHPLKRVRMSMLEIVIPTSKRRIQLGDDPCQTVPARALSSPHPNAILHRLVALFA